MFSSRPDRTTADNAFKSPDCRPTGRLHGSAASACLCHLNSLILLPRPGQEIIQINPARTRERVCHPKPTTRIIARHHMSIPSTASEPAAIRRSNAASQRFLRVPVSLKTLEQRRTPGIHPLADIVRIPQQRVSHLGATISARDAAGPTTSAMKLGHRRGF
jgi:hypothetical protein